jgi:hydroxymethylglutaryl-CoA lyase
MANSADVFARIKRQTNITYSALTPNLQGLDAAIAAGVTEVAVFAAASESFSHKNINCSISDSIDRFVPVIEKAFANNMAVRAYVSCVVGCPYEGDVDAQAVAHVAQRLADLGCYEVSLGDTIGVGTPEQIKRLLERVSQTVPVGQLAIHCHDTYGQAIANIYAALQCGVGGCPYAAGASGNVASEDVVYMLEGAGIKSGVNLGKLISAGNFISQKLGKPSQSKVARALFEKRK